MEDEERLAERGDLLVEPPLVEAVEEPRTERDAAAAEDDLRPPGRRQFGGEAQQRVAEVVRAGDGGDRRDEPRFGDASRRGERRRAAEAVADEERRREAAAAQEVGRGEDVGDVGREARFGEIPLAFADAGEVEPQARHAARRELARQPHDRLEVLAAGEAVREERRRALRPVGPLELADEPRAGSAGEPHRRRAHETSPPARGSARVRRSSASSRGGVLGASASLRCGVLGASASSRGGVLGASASSRCGVLSASAASPDRAAARGAAARRRGRAAPARPPSRAADRAPRPRPAAFRPRPRPGRPLRSPLPSALRG